MSAKPKEPLLVTMGREFGYPECCILSFATDMIGYIKGEKINRPKLHGTGYIPCVECNKKPEWQLLETNRTFPLPFPKDGY